MPYKDPKKQKEYHQRHYIKYRASYLARMRKRRKFFNDLLDSLKTRCSRCGYNECKQALHFHHANGDKKFAISRGLEHSEKAMLDEIKKCILLCANCHSKLHCTRSGSVG